MKNAKKISWVVCLFLLASCAATPKIYVTTGSMTMEVKRTAPYILAVDYAPDGKSVVSGGAGGAIGLWDLPSAGEAMKFTGHTGWISDLSFSPDGKTIASISLDGTIRFWDVATGKETQKISGYSLIDRHQMVRYFPDGKHVLGSTISSAKLHEVQTGKLLKEFSGKFINIGARIAPDGKTFLMPDNFTRGGGFTDIVSKDAATGDERWRAVVGGFTREFAYTPDGKQVLAVRQEPVSGGTSTNLVLLDAATGNKTREFPGIVSGDPFLSDWIDSLCLSPDGRFALTGDFYGNYKLWDIRAGTIARQFTTAQGNASTALNIRSAAAISPDGRSAVVAYRASARLFDVSTGNEIVTMITFADGEWLMITPEGYYNASGKGAQYLNVVVGDKDYSVEQFYDVFYRPDIVAAKLQGQDIKDLITITMADAIKGPPPMIDFTSKLSETDQPRVKVCYEARSTGGGIGEIRLFHNGKLIESDGYYREARQTRTLEDAQVASLDSKAIYEDLRGVTVRGKVDVVSEMGKPKGDSFEDCKEVETIPGENEVSVSAFNRNNTVQGFMKTIRFRSKVKPEDPHIYILAVGIDRYKDAAIDLKYAVKDANDIEKRLRARVATLYNPENIHYELLADAEATKAGIIGKINEIADKIKPQDGFILFAAGHGVLLQNQYYVLTHDFDGAVSDQSMISSNEIVEMSKKIKSLSQLFIFDTCHAGGVDSIISGLYDARMSVLARKMGLHIYASASDKQAAMDGYKGNGLFTYTLLDGLDNNKEADRNKDGKVTVVGLGEYAKKMTTNLSKEMGHSQTPLIINFGNDRPIYRLQ